MCSIQDVCNGTKAWLQVWRSSERQLKSLFFTKVSDWLKSYSDRSNSPMIKLLDEDREKGSVGKGVLLTHENTSLATPHPSIKSVTLPRESPFCMYSCWLVETASIFLCPELFSYVFFSSLNCKIRSPKFPNYKQCIISGWTWDLWFVFLQLSV